MGVDSKSLFVSVGMDTSHNFVTSTEGCYPVSRQSSMKNELAINGTSNDISAIDDISG
jgi:hypothetical protein